MTRDLPVVSCGVTVPGGGGRVSIRHVIRSPNRHRARVRNPPTARAGERYLLDLIGEDATGVGDLLKIRIGDVDSFVESIRRVAAGGSALDPEVVRRMVGRRRRNHPIDRLTPRDRQVLALMAEGRSNTGIAFGLEVSQAAVEKHVTALFQKLALADEPARECLITLVSASAMTTSAAASIVSAKRRCTNRSSSRMRTSRC